MIFGRRKSMVFFLCENCKDKIKTRYGSSLLLPYIGIWTASKRYHWDVNCEVIRTCTRKETQLLLFQYYFTPDHVRTRKFKVPADCLEHPDMRFFWYFHYFRFKEPSLIRRFLLSQLFRTASFCTTLQSRTVVFQFEKPVQCSDTSVGPISN